MARHKWAPLGAVAAASALAAVALLAALEPGSVLAPAGEPGSHPGGRLDAARLQEIESLLRGPGAEGRERRLARLREFCRANNNKAASTTMVDHFSTLAGLNRHGWNRTALRLSHYQLPGGSEAALKQARVKDSDQSCRSEAFKFTFVRHPFERLVSAYFNYLRKAPRKARARMRPAYEFHEIEVDEGGYGEEGPPLLSPEQVVDYVLGSWNADGDGGGPGRLAFHWEPAYRHCDFCWVEFDLVGSVEDFGRDFAAVAGVLGIRVDDKGQKNSSGKEEEQEDPAGYFFSNLTRSKATALYQVYRPDFEMFGYSPERYLAMAQS